MSARVDENEIGGRRIIIRGGKGRRHGVNLVTTNSKNDHAEHTIHDLQEKKEEDKTKS
jgi:hypothetical protein